MKNLMLTGLFCLITCISLSQFNHVFSYDTTRKYFPSSHGSKKWKPIVGFDAFRSFYSGKPVKFNGIRFGAEYRGVHRFGFGFYGLKRDLVFNDIVVDYPLATDTSLVKYSLNYAAFFYERVFYKNKKWEVSLPFYLGGGGLDGYVEGSDGIYYKFLATSFSLMNAGFGLKYYLFKWLAPRIGIGYRFTFNTEKSLRKSFNGAYYSFGVSVIISELYKSIFKNQPNQKQTQPLNK